MIPAEAICMRTEWIDAEAARRFGTRASRSALGHAVRFLKFTLE